MADMVKGWLRTRQRAGGMTYLWCYQRLRHRDGKMVENSVPLGLVAEIGDETAAWRLVGELGLTEKYIAQALSGKPTFGELCAAYIKTVSPFARGTVVGKAQAPSRLMNTTSTTSFFLAGRTISRRK